MYDMIYDLVERSWCNAKVYDKPVTATKEANNNYESKKLLYLRWAPRQQTKRLGEEQGMAESERWV